MAKMSAHMNLHNPKGGMTFEELLSLKEESMRQTAVKALEKGYVVTIRLTNKDQNYENEWQFDGMDQTMTMNEFFDILERFEDETSQYLDGAEDEPSK